MIIETPHFTYNEIENQIKDPIRSVLIARTLFAKQTFLLSSQTQIDWMTCESEFDLTHNSIIPAYTAAYLTTLQENTKIFRLLEDNAGTTIEMQSSLFHTIQLAKSMLNQIGCFGMNFNLVLHPQKYYELCIDGKNMIKCCTAELNPCANMPKGTIYKCPIDQYGKSLLSKDGLICPVDPIGQYLELFFGKHYQCIFNSPEEKSGKIITEIYPSIKHSQSIGILT